MTIFGKTFGEYLRFGRVFLILTLAVGLGRLVLSLAGLPTTTVRWLSVTVVFLVAVIYYAVAVHLRGFGSYRQLLVLIFNQSMVTQLVVVASILLAIVSGHDNIYSIPEYAGGQDGKTAFHAVAHLVVGVVGSLVFWLVGCLILWITKMAARRPATA